MAAPALATPRPGVRLAASGAAQSFARADAAWQRRAGRLIRVNSAYRDYNLQLEMYENWQAWLRREKPKPAHSMALHPDRSKHCLGLAIDTPDWATAGFLTFMAEYGWIQVAPNDPTERHHLEYQSGRDRHRNAATPAGGYEKIDSTPAPTAPKPKPIKRAGKNMLYVRREDGLVVSIPEGGPTHDFKSVEEYNLNRDSIRFINGRLPEKDRVTEPPALEDLTTVSGVALNVLILAHGAGK